MTIFIWLACLSVCLAKLIVGYVRTYWLGTNLPGVVYV